MKRLGVLVLAIALVVWWLRTEQPTAGALEREFAKATALGPGARISLAAMADSKWQRVFIFGPYTTAGMAARCLGHPVGNGMLHGLEHRDDVSVLVFQARDGRTHSVAVSRAAADFAADATGRSYALTAATFVTRQPPAGSWGNLMPIAPPPKRCI